MLQGRCKQKVIDDGGHEQVERMGWEVDSKAFRVAWRAACSSSSQSIVEIPAGNTSLVGPLDLLDLVNQRSKCSIRGEVWGKKKSSRNLPGIALVFIFHSCKVKGDDCISIVANSSNIEVRNVSCIAGYGISIGILDHAHALSKVEHILILTSAIKVKNISFTHIEGSSAIEEALQFTCRMLGDLLKIEYIPCPVPRLLIV
ncbi:hypothetical protein Syun_025844 [Stephania yunnanensis]|uniref:Uncharacterized protein n=1 Tax=Stephania yunnanensis TaxID=152371 RepID=A0AAP0F1A5_9MAGN